VLGKKASPFKKEVIKRHILKDVFFALIVRMFKIGPDA
jgi:hypothetical protein